MKKIILILVLLLASSMCYAEAETEDYGEMDEADKLEYLEKNYGIIIDDSSGVVVNGNTVIIKSGNAKLEPSTGGVSVRVEGGTVDVNEYTGMLSVTGRGVINAKNGNFDLGAGGSVSVVGGVVHLKNAELNEGSKIDGKKVTGKVKSYNSDTGIITKEAGEDIVIEGKRFSSKKEAMISFDGEKVTASGDRIFVYDLPDVLTGMIHAGKASFYEDGHINLGKETKYSVYEEDVSFGGYLAAETLDVSKETDIYFKETECTGSCVRIDNYKNVRRISVNAEDNNKIDIAAKSLDHVVPPDRAVKINKIDDGSRVRVRVQGTTTYDESFAMFDKDGYHLKGDPNDFIDTVFAFGFENDAGEEHNQYVVNGQIYQCSGCDSAGKCALTSDQTRLLNALKSKIGYYSFFTRRAMAGRLVSKAKEEGIDLTKPLSPKQKKYIYEIYQHLPEDQRSKFKKLISYSDKAGYIRSGSFKELEDYIANPPPENEEDKIKVKNIATIMDPHEDSDADAEDSLSPDQRASIKERLDSVFSDADDALSDSKELTWDDHDGGKMEELNRLSDKYDKVVQKALMALDQIHAVKEEGDSFSSEDLAERSIELEFPEFSYLAPDDLEGSSEDPEKTRAEFDEEGDLFAGDTEDAMDAEDADDDPDLFLEEELDISDEERKDLFGQREPIGDVETKRDTYGPGKYSKPSKKEMEEYGVNTFAEWRDLFDVQEVSTKTDKIPKMEVEGILPDIEQIDLQTTTYKARDPSTFVGDESAVRSNLKMIEQTKQEIDQIKGWIGEAQNVGQSVRQKNDEEGQGQTARDAYSTALVALKERQDLVARLGDELKQVPDETLSKISDEATYWGWGGKTDEAKAAKFLLENADDNSKSEYRFARPEKEKEEE